MTGKYWVAKPHRIVKANGPRDLGRQKVVVYPFSLPGGEYAVKEYLIGYGLSAKAVLDIIKYHRNDQIKR
jgi:hypothetical protein